jgi:DNA-binding winged helix-turn-helix (wHTH) protein/tetratricopeptide (TPR) repeat protein
MPTDSSAPTRNASAVSYEFGPFRLEAATRTLYRGDAFVALTPKAAETLLVLVEEAGRVVTKEQLLERVWPGVVVEEGGIANNISALRKVLDGAFEGEGPIATVARRGYRFTAHVRAHVDEAAAPAATPAVPSPRPFTSDPEPNTGAYLVCDFDNRTGDAIFDGTLRQALALHLAQSPHVEVLAERRVHSILGLMGRQGERLVGDVAMEVCIRANSAAAITGTIFALGDEYVIGLQAVDPRNGDVLVTEQARAKGRNEVLSALDHAAIGLRTKLGESTVSVQRFGRLLDEVATTSLEALKAYTVGREQWLIHGEAAAKPHQLRAIELDPNFASAYSALALACNNMGQTLEAHRYMQKAYDLRERVAEHERLRLEASYHSLVTGDLFKGLDPHRLWARMRPKDFTALGNLSNSYSLLGQWDKALEAAERAIVGDSTNIITSNLAIALMAVGRRDDARAVLERGFAQGFDAFYLHLDAYQEAFLRGDAETMRRHVAAVAGRGGEEDFLIAAEADTAAFHGQYSRARELTHRAIESARRADSAEMAASWSVEAALREAEVGERDRALAGATFALETAPGRIVRGMVACVYARAGDAERALRVGEALAREFPQDTLANRYWLPCMYAAIALGAGDWKAALVALEAAEPVELGVTVPFEGGFMYPAYLRGQALLGAGRADEAARELMKIVERPGLVKNFVLFPLAQLGAARAYARAGRAGEAGAMQASFESLWSAPDITPEQAAVHFHR